jgi:hypothetical protein
MAAAADGPWSGLCLSETLPFEFRPADAPPAPGFVAEADAANLQTLIVEATLGEARRGAESSELDSNRQGDLERLESKLDVLLGMVARLAAKEGPPGLPRRLRLFAQGLEWESSGRDPPAGSPGAAHVQVNPAFPQRLMLPGVVAGIRRGADGDWVQFRFEGVGDRVVGMLERLIFRRHRRQVAGTHG